MMILALVLGLFTSLSFAQEMEYPELNVTPRASDRVRLEAREEAGKAWSSHFSIQLSALSTLAAGAMVSANLDDEKNDRVLAPTVAMVTGALWLGVSTWSAISYRPYKETYLKLKKLPYKSKRDKLTVERLAEEELSAMRTMGRRIRWFSAATNLAASLFLLDSVKSDTDAEVAANVSSLLSVLPLFFKYHWEDVANEQDKYKKKIFSPVAMAPIITNPITQTKATGIALLYRF